MINALRTLRLRLVVLNLTALGLMQVALSAALFYVCARFFHAELDQRLIDGASTMVDAIDVAAEDWPPLPSRMRYQPHLNPFNFSDYYFQLRLLDGRIIEQSTNLGGRELPLSAAAAATRTTSVALLESLTEPQAVDRLGGGHALRMLTLFHADPDTAPYYLQVAVSLAPIDQSLAALRRAILWLVPAGLLLAALASWALARRSLAPIGRIAREAQSLSAAHLQRRLPLPPGRDEVTEMVVTLNGMLERLEAAFRSQERFIANAAHELRTPVTLLLGQAQVLARQQREPQDYAAFLASVQDEMRHLSQIVESLLHLARADAGLPLPRPQPVALNEVVADAVQRCHPLARQHHVHLQPQLLLAESEEGEAVVHGDAELLVAMISNLIRNAIRHSPAEAAVSVTVGAGAEDWTVAVRDRGPGVPPDQITHLFENPQEVRGTGLGLAIARSVAQLHQGRITVHNHPEGGCVFTVFLGRDAACG
jgi:signal transduction histidine kinase